MKISDPISDLVGHKKAADERVRQKIATDWNWR